MSVTLYSLSTCYHCKQVKEFLEENDIAFTSILVDKLEKEERKTALENLKKHNPRTSFPTLVINEGEKVIIGDHKDKLEEAFEL